MTTVGQLAVSFQDVKDAAVRLRGVAHRTPVITSKTLDERTGASVFLKAENLQRMGAFKFRGAYNRLAQISEAERHKGVVAFSSGNHAQGVALAAKILGIPATIVMPTDAPKSKRDATRGYGATIVEYDRMNDDRGAIAKGIASETGAAFISPFDDAGIIAGQGTTALELIEETGPLDMLFVCTGGGGLLSGCATAAVAMSSGVAVWGVEPETGDDWVQSLAANKRIEIPVPVTIADGMQTTAPGVLTFPIVQKLCAGVVTVTDDELRETMRFAFERLKLVIEPSGAAALAAIMFEKVPARGKRIGATLSGGNVDPALFAAVLAG